MWNIVKVWQTGSRRGTGKRTNHRRRGFTHPARFEVLEERLPLSAAGGSTELNELG